VRWNNPCNCQVPLRDNLVLREDVVLTSAPIPSRRSVDGSGRLLQPDLQMDLASDGYYFAWHDSSMALWRQWPSAPGTYSAPDCPEESHHAVGDARRSVQLRCNNGSILRGEVGSRFARRTRRGSNSANSVIMCRSVV
jgi:hypothetical protein